MKTIPLLQPDDDEIKESLSLEEIRIALTGLRKRFKQYTPHEIVQALCDYLAQKDFKAQVVPIGRAPITRYPITQYPRLPEPSFLHHRHYPITPDDRNQKVQQIRLVALLYCESGINYSLAQYFFPDMTQKQYKLDLEIITAQTLNNIEKCLRYEHNVQVDQLSRDEKYSIREKMLNVRDWMGKTHPEQIKTYFHFIERYYLNEAIQIEFKMALDLHRVILQAARGPQVQLRLTQANNNRGLRQQFNLNEEEKKGLTKEEESSLILLFKQHCSVERVSDSLCQKYGYHIRWSVHAVKKILMRVYKVALKRMVDANRKILGDKNSLWFGYGDEDVKLLMEYENSLQTKLLLLDFYLLAKITKLKLMEYIKKVNAFFVKQHQGDSGFEQIQDEEQVQIPTLIIEHKPIPTIIIKDQEQASDRSKKEPHPKFRKISKPPKDKKGRPLYREFITVESDEENQEVYIFSRDRAFFEKSPVQDDTDIQDEEPKNKHEKNIFKPNSNFNLLTQNLKSKTDLKNKKTPTHQQKTHKPQKTPQSPHLQQEQVKNQQIQNIILELKQKKPLKNLAKQSNLNKSMESSISEPPQLQNYRTFRQQTQIPESLKALIRKQLGRKEKERK